MSRMTNINKKKDLMYKHQVQFLLNTVNDKPNFNNDS